MKNEIKKRSKRSVGIAKSTQNDAPIAPKTSEDVTQQSGDRDNATHKESVSAELPKFVNTHEHKVDEPVKQIIETETVITTKTTKVEKTHSISANKFVNRFGSKCVYAMKGNAMCTFSETTWKLLGKDKNGWIEVVPEPPEVTALKQK